MADTLHYTFSTIPQVLAALIALLGVFWVFRMTVLNNKLKSGAEALRREVDSNDPEKKDFLDELKKGLIESCDYTAFDFDRLPVRIDSSIQQENFKWLYNTMCHMDKAVKNTIVSRVKSEYESIEKEISQLTTGSKRVIILSGIQIVLSIGFLISVPSIYSMCLLSYVVMISNFLFFMLIILISVKTILKTLKNSIIVH